MTRDIVWTGDEPLCTPCQDKQLFCSKVQANDIALTPAIIDEMVRAGSARLDQPDFHPPLYCSTCGVVLNPIEIALDLGDGSELLCDSCLHGTGAN